MNDPIHHQQCNECELDLVLADEAATGRLGSALAAVLDNGLVIFLEGDLGAGKTTLTRAVLRACKFDGNVKSPTYTLIEPYTVSRLNLYHFDFYRFTDPDEYLDAGLEEYFDGSGACIVEWPRNAAPHLPLPDLCIRLQFAEDGRLATISAASERGRTCVSKIREALG